MTNLQDDHHLPAGASPYASISATLGWETFHLVHTLWLGLMELPVKAPDKDWDMQVSSRTPAFASCAHWELDLLLLPHSCFGEPFYRTACTAHRRLELGGFSDSHTRS